MISLEKKKKKNQNKIFTYEKLFAFLKIKFFEAIVRHK